MVKVPSKKDRLFKHADDWWHNACLNFTSDPTEGYINGYKMAADQLVLQIEEYPRNQDYLVYPIVFLYRQYIELRLKEIIFQGNELFEIQKNPPSHHHLDKLWDKASNIVKKLDTTDEEQKYVKIVGGLIQEFSDVDPTSTRFRYAMDKLGNISLDGIRHINLRNLRDVVDKIASIIDGINMSINEQLREKYNFYS